MSDDPPTENLYAVLGVAENADIDQLRMAFRRLARRHHPDANPGDPEAANRFRLVTDAYRVLVDPRRRREHDRRVLRRRDADTPAGPDEGSVFQEAARRQAAPGRDVVAVLDVRLVDVASGGRFDVQVTGPVRCAACDGEGYDPGGRVVTCWTCGGSGVVSYDNRLGTSTGLCLTCGGEKVQHIDGCARCGGDGTVTATRTVTVTLPPGVDDGDTVTVGGEGGPGGIGAAPGDLLVVVRVAPHPLFRRNGLDLEVDVPITYLEAVFGADIEVPTLDGPLTMRLPPGTQGGSTHRLRGRGLSTPEATGDLLVISHVVVPTAPRPEERRALESLRPFEPTGLRDRLFD